MTREEEPTIASAIRCDYSNGRKCLLRLTAWRVSTQQALINNVEELVDSLRNSINLERHSLCIYKLVLAV